MERYSKPITVVALIRDDVGGVLILKPSYREDWTLPGGGAEQGEAPKKACERGVREALGVELPLGHLLCLDYEREGDRRSESLTFVFDGGQVTTEQVIDFDLPEDKLGDYEFAAPSVAVERLTNSQGRSLRYALAAQHNRQVLYLENKELV